MSGSDGLLLAGLCLILFAVSSTQGVVVFNQTSYSVTVDETSPMLGSDRPPYAFLSVECVDGLARANDVVYRINTVGTFPFTVNSTSGEFNATDDLDYEALENGRYSVQVGCFDPNNNTQYDSTEVVINLNPLNEHFPVVFPSTISVSVDENTNIGTVLASTDTSGLASYTVTDIDAGPDRELTYLLKAVNAGSTDLDDPNLNAFSVNMESGEVILARELEFDSQEKAGDFYDIELKVCDGLRTIELCSTLVVIVFASVGNHHDPQFSSIRYEVSIDEMSPPNTTLVTANCTDDDYLIGSFAGIEFSNINDSLSGLWSLNSETGKLTLNKIIDFDTAESTRFELVLRCYDSGPVERQDFATIVINILPINDIGPQFMRVGLTNNRFVFTVDRLTIPSDGAVIARLEATDGDVGEVTELRYTLTGSNNFDINPRTGDIFLNDYILAIEGTSFDLTATVSDGTFSDTVFVDISVTGPFSVVDLAIIGVAAVIVLLLLLLIICCSSFCYIKWCRKKTKTDSKIDLTEDFDGGPGHMMMYAAHPPFMVSQVPGPDDYYPNGYHSGYANEFPDEHSELYTPSLLSDEPEDLVSSPSTYNTNVAMGPILREMVDYFHDGDKELQGKKK